MELPTVTNPEPATDVVEQEVAPQDEVVETEGTEQEQPEDGQADDGLEDYEVEGRKYRIHPDLKPMLMMQGDYTKKTQGLADERRSLENQREAVRHEEAISREVLDDMAQVRAIDQRMHYLNSIDWTQLQNEQATQLMLELNQLRAAKENFGQRIGQRRSEIAAMRERETATALSQAIEDLGRPDERFGWSGKFDQQVAASITDAAVKLGWPRERLMSMTDSLSVKTLYLAMKGAEALQKQKTAPQRPVAQPAAKVPAAKATSTSDPAKMSMAQYAAWAKRRGT